MHWHCIVFQDWEDYIYIDPTVFGSAVMWLLNYQSEEGAFYETEYTERPLHYAMFSENRSYTQYYIRAVKRDFANKQCIERVTTRAFFWLKPPTSTGCPTILVPLCFLSFSQVLEHVQRNF